MVNICTFYTSNLAHLTCFGCPVRFLVGSRQIHGLQTESDAYAPIVQSAQVGSNLKCHRPYTIWLYLLYLCQKIPKRTLLVLSVQATRQQDETKEINMYGKVRFQCPQWSHYPLLGFRVLQLVCTLYNRPPLVDTRRSSSVSQPDNVILQGQLPH